MACNCAAGREINAIYRKFGHNLQPDKKKIKYYNLKKGLITAGVYVCMIPISLYLIFYVIKKGLSKNKDTNVSEFFGFKKVRNVAE